MDNSVNASFYLRRLHSLCGLVALGFFLMEHITTNASSLLGPEFFNGMMANFEKIPGPVFIGIELFCFAVPFLFHGIYGIFIALNAKNNTQSYGYARNWQFALQRWSAFYLVAFLIWHVGYLRVYLKGIQGIPMSYELVQAVVTEPVTFVLYILGMAAAIFHFCNGITTFCMTWGITKGPRSQYLLDKISMIFAAVLCVVVLVFMIGFMM